MLALATHPTCHTLRLSKAGTRGSMPGLTAPRLPRRLGGMHVAAAMRVRRRRGLSGRRQVLRCGAALRVSTLRPHRTPRGL